MSIATASPIKPFVYYCLKLQSEKRKQDLLAEIVFEEQRGRELSKMVKELIPATKTNSIPEPPRGRKVHTSIVFSIWTIVSLKFE